MSRTGIVLFVIVVLLTLTGCPSKGGGSYSDPSAARERADKAMKELDRETRK